ncbi:MAG: hypothetical protein H7Y02_09555 [Candidatus Obscuribacterales bacterium]|nr:hypothetical protein [Steroidobacteraceae bacterium]
MPSAYTNGSTPTSVRQNPAQALHESAPPEPYIAKQFDFSKVHGLSTRALEVHQSLYETYVKEANALLPLVYASPTHDASSPTERLQYDGLVRRLAFELNGVTLHELFFESLGGGNGNAPDTASIFGKALKGSYGSYEAWKHSVAQIAKTRGVGWVLTLRSGADNRVCNVWIDDHTDGFLADMHPIVAFDLWEHAYLLDFKPSERHKYLEVLFENINWNVIESRCR